MAVSLSLSAGNEPPCLSPAAAAAQHAQYAQYALADALADADAGGSHAVGVAVGAARLQLLCPEFRSLEALEFGSRAMAWERGFAKCLATDRGPRALRALAQRGRR